MQKTRNEGWIFQKRVRCRLNRYRKFFNNRSDAVLIRRKAGRKSENNALDRGQRRVSTTQEFPFRKGEIHPSVNFEWNYIACVLLDGNPMGPTFRSYVQQRARSDARGNESKIAQPFGIFGISISFLGQRPREGNTTFIASIFFLRK